MQLTGAKGLPLIYEASLAEWLLFPRHCFFFPAPRRCRDGQLLFFLFFFFLPFVSFAILRSSSVGRQRLALLCLELSSDSSSGSFLALAANL